MWVNAGQRGCPRLVIAIVVCFQRSSEWAVSLLQAQSVRLDGISFALAAFGFEFCCPSCLNSFWLTPGR